MIKKKYIIVIILFGLFSCTSQKKLQSQIPFEVGTSTCEKWVGGRESSGSGMQLMIVVNFPQESNIVLKEIYFRGKQAPATLVSVDDNKFIKAEFLINEASSKETSGFKLQATEAVLSYVENNTLKYTKISGIKEKQPLLYNSRPKN